MRYKLLKGITYTLVAWYTDMFKLKEDRITFTEDDLVKRLRASDFKEITTHYHITKGFSIRDWLVNSGVDPQTQNVIMNLHYSASQHIKLAYNMHFAQDDCIIDTKNLIMVARK